LKNNTLAWMAALALLFAAAPINAELLKLSLLRRSAPRFALKLDIFQGGGGAAANPAPEAAAVVQAEIMQRSIAEEIAQSVSYEGFIIKNSRQLALLNVSGEFFAVAEQETVMEKIKILKIAKDKVTVEYDGQPYEIPIKGDANG